MMINIKINLIQNYYKENLMIKMNITINLKNLWKIWTNKKNIYNNN